MINQLYYQYSTYRYRKVYYFKYRKVFLLTRQLGEKVKEQSLAAYLTKTVGMTLFKLCPYRVSCVASCLAKVGRGTPVQSSPAGPETPPGSEATSCQFVSAAIQL